MMDRCKKTIPLLFLTAFFARSSLAALGANEQSVETDQTHIVGPKSVRAVTTHSKYRMHEIAQENLTVHEFVTTDGKVFAVTWVGPVHPDFSVLFGDYFKNFQNARNAVQNTHLRRRSGTLEDGDLHVEYGGQMASQRGRAWVKSLLPEGFKTDDVR